VADALLSALAGGRSLVLRDDGAGGLVLVETSRSGASSTHAPAGEPVGAAWAEGRGVLFGRLPADTGFVAVEVDSPGDENRARVHLAAGVWVAVLPAAIPAVVVFHDARGGETARLQVAPPDQGLAGPP
jgi:hypothetical protein